MGQYYKIMNLDKKQYLSPSVFGDGIELLEFGLSGYGTMTALAVLLADGCGRGGGGIHSEHPAIGYWKSDRIVVAGDYADNNRYKEEVGSKLYDCEDEQGNGRGGWLDISMFALEAMTTDEHTLRVVLKHAADDPGSSLLEALVEIAQRLTGQSGGDSRKRKSMIVAVMGSVRKPRGWIRRELPAFDGKRRDPRIRQSGGRPGVRRFPVKEEAC